MDATQAQALRSLAEPGGLGLTLDFALPAQNARLRRAGCAPLAQDVRNYEAARLPLNQRWRRPTG
jgi:hypothetical protein